MSKNKKTKQIKIEPPANMTADELQHIIVQAILEVEKIKADKEEIEKEKWRAEFKKKIGYKEHKSEFKKTLNMIKSFFKILFLRDESIEGNIVSSSLIGMLLSGFFRLLELFFIICFILLIVISILPYIFDSIPSLGWQWNICFSIYIFLAVIFLRLFHIASIEVEKCQDNNYLFGLFASVSAIISIAIAVISLVKS